MCFRGNMAVNTIQASAPIGTLRRLAISLLSVLLRSKRLANPAFCAFLYSRSPWLYADKVGVGSLGRTFRRSRNSAGAFAPAGVPSGTQCAPSLVCRISPTAAGSFTVNKKRKRYLRLKKAPFGAFCFAHVVSRSTISEQSTTRLFTLFPPSMSRIVFAAVMLWSYNILSRDVNAGVDISA